MTNTIKGILLAAIVAVASVSASVSPALAMQRDGSRVDREERRHDAVVRRNSQVCHTEKSIQTQPSYVDKYGVKHVFGPAPVTKLVCVKK